MAPRMQSKSNFMDTKKKVKKNQNDSQKSVANLIYLSDFICKKCQICEKHHNKWAAREKPKNVL